VELRENWRRMEFAENIREHVLFKATSQPLLTAFPLHAVPTGKKTMRTERREKKIINMTKRVLSIDKRKRNVRCKRTDDEFCIHEKYAFNLSTMLRRVTDKVRM